MSKSHPVGSRAAFTLIELLVVISIIALLIGIMLPALGAARDTARSAACASNLRQMVTAWVTYETDHGAIMLAGDYRNAPTFQYWWGRSDGVGNVEPNAGYISPYIPYGTVEGCPTWGNDIDVTWWGRTSYGYNWQYFPGLWSAGDVLPELEIADINSPIETMVFADAVRMNSPGAMQSSGWPSAWYATARDFLHGRHYGGKGNVAWADGHVGSREPSYFATDSFDADYLQSVHLGFIDGDDDPVTPDLFDLE